MRKITLLFNDIQKYFPEFNPRIFEQRYSQIIGIIKEGQKQGIVREEINSEIFALMCCQMLNDIAYNEFLEDSYSQKEQIKFLVDMLCCGICRR